MSNDNGDNGKRRGVSPLNLAERFLEDLLARFPLGKNEKRWRFAQLLFTAFLLTLLITPLQHFASATFKAGSIATSDIRATQDYLLEDRVLTEQKRNEAESAVPFIYLFDNHASVELSQRFERVNEAMGLARQRGDDLRSQDVLQEVSKALGVPVSPEELALLSRVRTSQSLSAEIGRAVSRIFGRKIVADKNSFAHHLSHGIVVLDQDTKLEIASGDNSEVTDVAEVRTWLAKARLFGGEPAEQEVKRGLLAKFVRPTLIFDRGMTEARKREARAAARPVLFQIKRGEMIVRVGERITEEEALKLESIHATRPGINQIFLAAGIFGLVLVLFYFPYRFARKNIRKFNPTNKDLFLLSVLSIGMFLSLKLSLILSTAMGGAFPAIDTVDYHYLFPFAAGAILVRIILNSEVALVFCAVCAPLVGMMFNNNLPIVIYSLVGGIIGAHGVRHCADRGTIYTAGMKVSVVNMALVLSFQVFSDSLFTMQTVYCAIFAVAGGFLNAAIVAGTIPVVESVFQYTTDIKLLEMANLNSPILRELMVRAPGTYHHSVLVGNLVEAAAETINANPLLARVAAYYHDIGKLSKPLYFIENVTSGENRHDRLSPSMSALILISHVKEGVELAREQRLGLPIIDIIRQSHGTNLITYFYQKARSMSGPDGKPVSEADFRYPGPKPQTREAGLVLLADCVEAASRTLNDPTPARIQGMVQKIINNIFIDGQLDECELTLKNLHEIAKSFNRVLTGIYHHRIDYPEPAYKEKANSKKATNDTDNEPAKTAPDRDEETKKGGGDDLKRLGISRQ